MPPESSSKPALRQVNLPHDVIDTLDAIGLNISAALKTQTGVDIELSRPQIIAAIAKAALDRQDAEADAVLDAEEAEEDDTDEDES